MIRRTTSSAVGRPLQRVVVRPCASALALALVALAGACQAPPGGNASSGSSLEGPDRAEGRELTDLEMGKEMDEISPERYDVDVADIGGGE
ncbi:MAG: hypothetical protein U0575_11440 [Phycisphaerales bacterium]